MPFFLGRAMTSYNPQCRECPRLASFLDEVKRDFPSYFCKPVPPFGVAAPELLIVGLAPGLHGANRTGRPFTGDYAGELLYQTLHKFGYATQPTTVKADGTLDTKLKLKNARISNAVKCLPPGNKPTPAEIRECNHFLAHEIATLPVTTVMVALGGIAHDAVLAALGLKRSHAKFGHANKHVLPDGRVLFDSYHCSRYNTNTKRLTPEAFQAVFAAVRAHISGR